MPGCIGEPQRTKLGPTRARTSTSANACRRARFVLSTLASQFCFPALLPSIAFQCCYPFLLTRVALHFCLAVVFPSTASQYCFPVLLPSIASHFCCPTLLRRCATPQSVDVCVCVSPRIAPGHATQVIVVWGAAMERLVPCAVGPAVGDKSQWRSACEGRVGGRGGIFVLCGVVAEV